MKKVDYPTEVLEVMIEKLDREGIGYARYCYPSKSGNQGKVLHLFVRNTVPGDLVKVTVENARGRKKAVLDFDQLVKAGPSRDLTVPMQQVMSGGVPLQCMRYADQLAYKEQLVRTSLSNQDFDSNLVQKIIGMEEPRRYRNKMELTFGSNGEIGMHQQGNYRKIIDLKDSILAPKEMIAVKKEVSAWQQANHLSGYDKDNHHGLLRNLLIRKSFATGELMVAIFASQEPKDYREAAKDLITRLQARFVNLKSLLWVEHRTIIDRIQTDAVHLLYGREYIKDTLAGFSFRIYHDTFFQANPLQAEKMVEVALDLADVRPDMRVLDLFCGVGTFSLPLAQRAKELCGIEIVEHSILSARRNAKDNAIDNARFIVSDARRGLHHLEENWGRPDLLLLDPPRSGAGGKVMRSIGRLATEKVIYVSCNPKSLADDLVYLRNFGYKLEVVQPIDQFPHTNHVESIILMSR